MAKGMRRFSRSQRSAPWRRATQKVSRSATGAIRTESAEAIRMGDDRCASVAALIA